MVENNNVITGKFGENPEGAETTSPATKDVKQEPGKNSAIVAVHRAGLRKKLKNAVGTPTERFSNVISLKKPVPTEDAENPRNPTNEEMKADLKERFTTQGFSFGSGLIPQHADEGEIPVSIRAFDDCIKSVEAHNLAPQILLRTLWNDFEQLYSDNPVYCCAILAVALRNLQESQNISSE